MAISVQLRPSADAGNALTFGPDGGLTVEGLTESQYANPVATIDNSFATPAANLTTYHPTTSGNTANVAVNNTATFQLVQLTRSARIVEVFMNFVNTATTSTWSVYGSVFTADATTGLPSVKVTDLFRFTNTTVTAASNFFPATMLDTTTVFTGHTPYWLAMWGVTSGSFPAVSARSAMATLPSRTGVTPTGFPAGNNLTYTAAGWTAASAPASVTFTATSPNNLTAPFLWFGVRNV